MKTINENSRLPVTVRIFNDDVVAAIPTTLRYRIDCETTRQNLVGWTTLTPASVVSLTIPATINVIQSRLNSIELKTLTIEADSGLSTAFTAPYQWQVRSLQAFN